MKILKTDLYGVMKIELESFCDHRGKYTETYNEDAYNASGVNVKFIQDDISFSKKNVLRGIHGDEETYKLVSCLLGSFVLIVVNIKFLFEFFFFVSHIQKNNLGNTMYMYCNDHHMVK